MARQARELRKLKIILKILLAQPAQLNACPVKCVTYFTGVSQKPSEADLTGVKFLPNEMFTPLNACPMKYEVNFIGAKPVYLGRSQFHRGFPKKRNEADLTG